MGVKKKGPTQDFQLANKKEKQSIMFEGLHSRPALAESRKMKWDKTRICKVVCSFSGVVRGGREGRGGCSGIKKRTNWHSRGRRGGLVNIYCHKY